MSTVSRSRLKSLLGVGALLGIALFSQPPSVGAMAEAPAEACTERNLGGGMVMVDCGSHRWCYQNNVFSGAC
jgi:hypothetical protein